MLIPYLQDIIANGKTAKGAKVCIESPISIQILIPHKKTVQNQFLLHKLLFRIILLLTGVVIQMVIMAIF